MIRFWFPFAAMLSPFIGATPALLDSKHKFNFPCSHRRRQRQEGHGVPRPQPQGRQGNTNHLPCRSPILHIHSEYIRRCSSSTITSDQTRLAGRPVASHSHPVTPAGRVLHISHTGYRGEGVWAPAPPVGDSPAGAAPRLDVPYGPRGCVLARMRAWRLLFSAPLLGAKGLAAFHGRERKRKEN